MDINAWLEYIEGLHTLAIDYRLEPVQAFYQKLNLPRIAKTILTVTGTNGKGSTVTLLEDIYIRAGYKVASFISPHLLKFNERVRIGGEDISDEELIQAFNVIEQHRDGQNISYFSFVTLAALYLFAQADLDVVILEVGMGGRKDAVNVVENDLAIITSVGLDHTSYLGETVEQIAYEKAGIIKSNSNVIVGARVAQDVIAKCAAEQNSNCHIIDQDFTLTDFHYLPELTMHPDNAAVVCKAVQLLQDKLPVREKFLRDAFKNFFLMGRKQHLVINRRQLILDVAHNEEAVEYLAQYLEENNLDTVSAVFGGLNTKNTAKLLEKINHKIKKWFLVKVDSPLSINPQDFVVAEKECEVFDNVKSGVDAALAESKVYDTIVVFGSFYTVKPVVENYVC